MKSLPRPFFLAVLFLFVALWSCAPFPATRVEKPSPLTLSELSLEEKIGQMFMIRYSGQFYNENSYAYREARRLITEFHVGGLISFFGSLHGTIANLNELQNLSRIPLLVAADYERGVGQQLDGATLFPTNMALAATNDPTLAYKQGMVTAKEARAIGVHLTFAPVMDVNSNPDNPIINFRSFGDSPEAVSRFGVEFIKGCQNNGLLATAKHFPGHGDTYVDSHTNPPVITAQKEKIRRVDLAPFRASIEAGVRVIMVGHIIVPSLDHSGRPATLSPELNGRLLRDELGFGGLIVTDAMEMGSITNSFWAGEAAIQAIEAGTDLVLLPLDVNRAIESVVNAVKTGRLSEKRIDESVARILLTKRDLGLWENKTVSLQHAQSVLRKSDFHSVASEIARKSITLVKDDEDQIPLELEKIDTLFHILLSTDEGLMSTSRPFQSTVSQIHGNAKTRFIYEPLSRVEIGGLVEEAQRADLILCTLLIRVRMHKGTVSIDETHRRLISELQATGKPTVVVSFGSPYVKNVDSIGTYLCAYGYGDISQYAMADAIFGATSISGKLPVDLSSNLRRGTGLLTDGRQMLTPSSEKVDFSEAKQVLESAIHDSIFPGAEVVVTKDGETLWSYQVGRQTYDSDSPLVTENTIYDLASLTKVVATTPIVMKLVESKLLPLDEPVYHFFPGFIGAAKERVTIRHLLTHSSGLRPYTRFFAIGVPPENVISHIVSDTLIYTPGDSSAYSDLGILLLGAIIEKVSGQSLDQMAASKIYRPLGMKDTFFNPDSTYLSRIAPTEVDSLYRKGTVHGVVHDENSWWLGGVAAHAGLFSTAKDLARYAQMMMDGGIFEGRRYFNRSTVVQFTQRQNISPGSSRALGWDTPSDSLSSAGDYFTPGSFGHLGFTGTSMWIDPNQRIAIILLSNRVYPSRERGGMFEVRRDFHNAVMRAITNP